MRVLHVGKYFPPHPGGIENYCADLCEGLKKLGVECHALVHNDGWRSQRNQAVTRSATMGRLAFAPVAPLFGWHLLSLLRNWRPDLLHFHLPNASAHWAMLLPAARRLPWVAHWHSDIVSSSHDARLRVFYPLYRPFERRLLRRCAKLIATSPAYAESSIPLNEHRERVEVIPLGANPDRLDQTYMPIRTRQRPSGALRLLAIGRLTYYKGFDSLIEALARVPDCTLTVVGAGEQEVRLRELIQRLNLTERVNLAGGISDSQRNQLMADCDVFCLPSIERTEAFGIVLMEAMHAGKPVVASNIEGSGVPWVIQQAGNGILVEPGNVAELTAALRQLQSVTERERLAAPARERFDALFHIERSARQCAELYLRVLDADSV